MLYELPLISSLEQKMAEMVVKEEKDGDESIKLIEGLIYYGCDVFVHMFYELSPFLVWGRRWRRWW